MKMSELCQIEKYKSPSDTPPKAAKGGGEIKLENIMYIIVK